MPMSRNASLINFKGWILYARFFADSVVEPLETSGIGLFHDFPHTNVGMS